MATKNKVLYDKAMEALMELFSDTLVSPEEMIDNLRTLQSEIEDLITVLQVDVGTGDE